MRKGLSGIKKRSLLAAALVLTVLAGGLLALVLLRVSGTKTQQRGFYHIEQAADGSLLVYDDVSARPDAGGIIRDHGTGKWWLCENGRVRTDYTGFAESGGERWYVDGGLVDFAKNGPVISGADSFFVLGGRALSDYTGLTRDFKDCPALMLRSGSVDDTFTGLAQNEDGWWYVRGGRIDREKTGLVTGRVNGLEADWYVQEGKVRLGFNGYIPDGDGALLLIDGGHTAPERSGILPDGKRFRHVENGRVDLSERRTLEEDGVRWVLMDGCAWKVTDDRGHMLYDAMSVLQEITTPDMTREEKLRACFDYVKGHSEGMSRSPHLLRIDWPEVYAADLFEGDGGNCCSFAAAFAYLVRAAGYTEVYACNSGGHGWAEGDGLIYDPERAANSYLNPCFGFEYQYAVDYRQAMETYASDPVEYDWMHVKIFDENREET